MCDAIFSLMMPYTAPGTIPVSLSSRIANTHTFQSSFVSLSPMRDGLNPTQHPQPACRDRYHLYPSVHPHPHPCTTDPQPLPPPNHLPPPGSILHHLLSPLQRPIRPQPRPIPPP